MNVITKNIPNSITCLNLLAGFASLIFGADPFAMHGSMAGWQWAVLFIGVAAVADFADGFMARLLGAYSELGKQLDSLSDNVSFGVAPAFLMFNIFRNYPGVPEWMAWVCLIIPVCGALRLARFNIDTRQSEEFIGLPIPANAIFWIGYAACVASSLGSSAAFGESSGIYIWSGMLTLPAVAVPIIIIEALLMVCNMRMFSLKFKTFGWKGNGRRWIILIASAALLICFGLPAFSLIIILYLLLSIKN